MNENEVYWAFNFPLHGEYVWIQLPPTKKAGLRGYIVRVEDLPEVIDVLMAKGTSRFMVWGLTPLSRYRRRPQGAYRVKHYEDEPPREEIILPR